MITPAGPLDYEQHALRWTLKRLLGEERNLESLCKLVPKLANSAANVAKARAAVTSTKAQNNADVVLKALQELVEERAMEEEESQW